MGDKAHRRWIVGIIIVVLGLVWLSNNLGLTNVHIMTYISLYWPLALIVISGVYLFEWFFVDKGNDRSSIKFVGSLVLLVLAIYLQAKHLGWITLGIDSIGRIILPVLIILLGINIITKK
ncbi:MAG: LiaF transmembrane domain-containing protein [Candidatus Saccharibacteria bacterium]